MGQPLNAENRELRTFLYPPLVRRPLLPSHFVCFLHELSQFAVNLRKMRQPDAMHVIVRRIELNPIQPRMLPSPLQPQSDLKPVLPHQHAGKTGPCLEYDPRFLRVDRCRTEGSHQRLECPKQLARNRIFPFEVVGDQKAHAGVPHITRKLNLCRHFGQVHSGVFLRRSTELHLRSNIAAKQQRSRFPPCSSVTPVVKAFLAASSPNCTQKKRDAASCVSSFVQSIIEVSQSSPASAPLAPIPPDSARG